MFNTADLVSFNRANVLVFGDLMLDRYWLGPSDFVSPEAPVPIVKIEKQHTRPGGAANVALNLAVTGAQVNLLGVVGKDKEALDLTAQLEEKNIDCHFHFLPGYPTITKLRVIARNQQMLRLDFETPFVKYDDNHLIDIYKQQLKQANVVLFSDYGKGTLQNIPHLISLASAMNIPVMVDPKGNDYSIYAGATLITPNLSEFEAVVGPCKKDDDLIIKKARELINKHNFGAILITRSEDGMTLVFSGNKKPKHFRAQAREVFDVTGAGDTVIAFIAAAVGSGFDLEHSAYLANLAAGIVVGKIGTAYVTLPELREALRNKLGCNRGILSKEELLSVVKDAKAKGEKIVMTNGCFDILHIGHVQYLNQAKDLGDRLIVAINSDASVKSLKGESRPINSLNARMEMLSALRPVDWIVSFSEETPEALIRDVLPDYLVKGGDYIVEEIAGHKDVLKNGGQVKILPYREGYSTTKIIEKL